MNKRMVFIFFIFILLFISSATIIKKDYYPVNKSELSEAVNKKVIIFYRSTKFRESVVDQVIAKFNEKGINVTVDSVNEFKNYKVDEYDLIIIFTGIYALTPNYSVRNAMKKSDYKDKIIHVYCNYLYGFEVGFMYDKNTKVDTITSASSSKNIEQVVEKIIKISEEKIKN